MKRPTSFFISLLCARILLCSTQSQELFTCMGNTAISGYNTRVYTSSITLEQCKALCIGFSWCRSMEHNAGCQLSTFKNGDPGVVITRSYVSQYCELAMQCTIPTIDKALVFSTNGSIEARNNITIKCDHGYELLDGSKKTDLQCTAYGQWNSTLPKCLPADDYDSQIRSDNRVYLQDLFDMDENTCVNFDTTKKVRLDSMRTESVEVLGNEIRCNPVYGEVFVFNSAGSCPLHNEQKVSNKYLCQYKCKPRPYAHVLFSNASICELMYN